MPFKSEKQRRYLWLKHPDIAKHWADTYPTKKDLPMYADDTKANEKQSMAAQILTRVLPNNLRKFTTFDPTSVYSANIKRSDSKQEYVKLPVKHGPTFAGESDAQAVNKPAEDGLNNNNSPSPEKQDQVTANSLFKKLAVVLSPVLMQEIENEQAMQQAREAQRMPKNVGLRQTPPTVNSIMPPMGMAQPAPNPGQTQPAQPAQPQQPQQPQQPANGQLASVGGGGSPNSNPINAFGGLSSAGDINGNASLGTRNMAGGEKMSAGNNALARWMRIDKQAGLFYRDLAEPRAFMMHDNIGSGLGAMSTQEPRLLTSLFSNKNKDVQRALNQLDPTAGNTSDPSKHISSLLGQQLIKNHPSRYIAPSEQDHIGVFLNEMDSNPEPTTVRALNSLKKDYAPMTTPYYLDKKQKDNFNMMFNALLSKRHLPKQPITSVDDAMWELAKMLNKSTGKSEKTSASQIAKKAGLFDFLKKTPKPADDWAPPATPRYDREDENSDYRVYDKQYGQWEKDLRRYLKGKGYSQIKQHYYEPGGTPLSMRGRDGKYHEVWYPEENELMRPPTALEDIYDSGDPNQAYRKGPGLMLVGPKSAAAGGARALARELEEQGASPEAALAIGLLTVGGAYGAYYGGKKLLTPALRRMNLRTLPADEIRQFALPMRGKKPYQFAEQYREPGVLGGFFMNDDETNVSDALLAATKKSPGMAARLEDRSWATHDLDLAGQALVKQYPDRYRLPTKSASQLYKAARPLGLDNYSSFAGPDQIQHAVQQYGQLKALVRPDDNTLRARGLNRNGFQSALRHIVRNSQGQDKYNLSDMAPNPNLYAGAAAGLGLLGTAGLGYLGGMNGAGVGLAGTGVGMTAAYMHAANKRKNILNTAKLMKEYGLLKPKLLSNAYPLLSDDTKFAGQLNPWNEPELLKEALVKATASDDDKQDAKVDTQSKKPSVGEAMYIAGLQGNDAWLRAVKQYAEIAHKDAPGGLREQLAPLQERGLQLRGRSIAHQAVSPVSRMVSDALGSDNIGGALINTFGAIGGGPEVQDKVRKMYAASDIDSHRDKPREGVEPTKNETTWHKSLQGMFADKDYAIAGHAWNRKNHPLQYWLNPLVRTGPLSELSDRLIRRNLAGVTEPETTGSRAFRASVPLMGEIMGGQAAQDKLRASASAANLYKTAMRDRRPVIYGLLGGAGVGGLAGLIAPGHQVVYDKDGTPSKGKKNTRLVGALGGALTGGAVGGMGGKVFSLGKAIHDIARQEAEYQRGL